MADNYTRRINLYINGKEVKNELASIKGEMNKLIAQQARMTIGSQEYVKVGKEIKVLKGIIQEHNESLKATGSTWDKLGKMGDRFNQYFTMFAAFAAGLGGLIYSGKQAITAFAEFDDKVGDVMKTTGLAKDRVYALNEELKKMDTRSSQIELLDLARIAGKLGINTEKDVMGFVRAADKINVALKEDLGGDTEESIRQIGKLVDIFKVKDKFGIEDSMLKVGSAINALGAASTANEGYMVEFAKRVGGIAPQAGVSIQNVIGLAATLDQLGQTSEVSSTVVSAVMSGMFKDTATYAKVAGMEVGKFSKLLKTDANEAFIKVMEGLRGNTGGMDELTSKMGDLGLEGKRSIAVLGVLANNTDILRQQQAMSNEEFAKGTSLTNEFNTKNETAQAKLDKARKSLSNLTVELGQKLMPVLTVSTSGFSYFVKAMGVLTDFVIKHKGALITLITTIAAYTLATKLATLWSQRATKASLEELIIAKAKNIILEASVLITNLYAAAQMLLAGNIKGATQAMRVFTATTKMNPLGALVGLITLAVGAFMVMKDGISDTAKAASELFSSLVKQRGEMNNLFEIVKKTGEGTKERADGIQKINDVYGQYLPKLLTEKSSLNEITTAQIAANIALRESIALKSKDKAIQEILEKSADRQKDYFERLVEIARKNRGDAAAGLFSSELADVVDFGRTNGYEKSLEKFNALKVKYGLHVKDWGDVIKYSANESFFQIMDAVKNEKDELEKLDAFYASFMGNRIKDLSVEEQISALRNALSRAETKEEKKNIQEQIALLEKRNKAKNAKPENNPDAVFTPDTKEKKKYSLNDDLEYVKQKGILNKNFADGEITSREELDRKLLDLEISYLEKALKSGKYEGEQLANMQSELDDKKIKRTEEKLKARQFMLDAAGVSELEKEKQRYANDLAEFNKYVGNKKMLNKEEFAALAGIKKTHQQKLGELDAKAMTKEIESKKQAFDNEFQLFKENNLKELNGILSLEQAKEVLKGSLTDRELNKLKSLEEAKKAIKKKQLQDEIKMQTDQLNELIGIISKLQAGEDVKGVSLADKILSPEEVETLKKYFAELLKAKNELSNKGDKADESKVLSPLTNKADILGFTSDDWNRFFNNIKNGTDVYGEWVSEVAMGIETLSSMYQSYFSFIEAGEKRELQNFETAQNKKKKDLKKQLDSGLISQESYTQQVDALDAQSEAKKAQFDYDSAVRQRNVAFMGALVNTALGVTKALAELGPFGIPMAIAIGAMGALQAGAILATPLPELPGKETGGYIDVTRAQDGKRFRAKHDPDKRGFVNAPTVITGENGEEYITPEEGVNNPTVRPVLDILEMARQNKSLATLDFAKAYASTTLSNRNSMSGRESGGRFNSARFDSAQRPGTANLIQNYDSEIKAILKENISVIRDLKTKLEDPIQTYVTVHGKNGLSEKLKEYESLKNNASL